MSVVVDGTAIAAISIEGASVVLHSFNAEDPCRIARGPIGPRIVWSRRPRIVAIHDTAGARNGANTLLTIRSRHRLGEVDARHFLRASYAELQSAFAKAGVADRLPPLRKSWTNFLSRALAGCSRHTQPSPATTSQSACPSRPSALENPLTRSKYSHD